MTWDQIPPHLKEVLAEAREANRTDAPEQRYNGVTPQRTNAGGWRAMAKQGGKPRATSLGTYDDEEVANLVVVVARNIDAERLHNTAAVAAWLAWMVTGGDEAARAWIASL